MTDTPTAPEFTITRVLDAPRELVWRAWTDPAELAHWLYPQGVSTPPDSISVDLREGGRYAYTMVEDSSGTEYPAGGVYLEIQAPERLVFTWSQPEDASESSPVATVTLTDLGERTQMVFHLLGIAGVPGDDNVYDGWDQALESLAGHLGTLAAQTS